MYNLGLGKGLSVLELIKLFEETTGVKIPTVWAGRRVGDVDTLVCNAQLAYSELSWTPQYDSVRMCKNSTTTTKKAFGREGLRLFASFHAHHHHLAKNRTKHTKKPNQSIVSV